MIRTATDSTVMKAIEFLHPSIVKEVRIQIEPRLLNLERIPSIAKLFALEESTEKLHFIACVIKLYDPAMFVSEKALKRGIAPKIASILGCTRSNVSIHADTAKYFYRFYSDFQNIVDAKFKEVIGDG